MALLYMDGFDHYAAVEDMMRSSWWTSVTSETISNWPRFPSGRIHGNGFAINTASLTYPSKLKTSIVGLATYPVDSNGDIQFDFRDGASTTNTYVRVVLDSSTGTISAITYGTDSLFSALTVGSTSAGLYNPATWNFVEIKVVIANTATGSIIVRLNGSVVLSLTNIQTRRFTGGGTDGVNVLAMTGNQIIIDDLFLLDDTVGAGSRPMNDFIGDKRVVTLSPTANVSTQFTSSGEISTEFFTTSTSTTSISANTLYVARFSYVRNESTNNLPVRWPRQAIEASQHALLNSVKLFVNATVAGVKIRPVVFSESATAPNTPGNLLAQGDERIGLNAGENSLTFSTPPTLVKGQRYYLGWIADTGFTLNTTSFASASTFMWTAFSHTYTLGAPSSVVQADGTPALSTGFAVRLEYTYTPVSNYGAVNEAHNDNGATYNGSSTLNDKDLFSTDAIVPASSVVWGVQVTGSYAKDDANARSMANVLKSGSTEVTGSNLALATLSYQYINDVYSVNPDGNTDWTVSAANAAQIGYKITV